MPDLERAEKLRQQRVVLISNRNDVKLKVKGTIGEADLTESIYAPILDLLESHKIMTLGEMEKELEGKDIVFTQLHQAIMVLAGANHVAAVNSDATIKRARVSCDKINAHLLNIARSSGDSNFLASPVIGGGLESNRIKQLFMLAIKNGKKTPEEWANYAWQILSVQGVKLILDGKTIESDEENLTMLLSQANEFSIKDLALLKSLQIV